MYRRYILSLDNLDRCVAVRAVGVAIVELIFIIILEYELYSCVYTYTHTRVRPCHLCTSGRILRTVGMCTQRIRIHRKFSCIIVF
jgi:hypothetical protein